MASLRMNPELLKLAGLIEKNDRLSSYEKMRQAINAKPSTPSQGRPEPEPSRLDRESEPVVNIRPQQDPMPWKADDNEYRSNLKAAIQMLGSGGPIRQDDVTQASELVRAAYEKYGSVDPMKMRQILRYSSDDEPEVALPAKGSR